MKKMLVVFNHLIIGGIEQVLLSFLEKYSDDYEIDLLLLFDEGDWIERVPQSVKVIPGQLPPQWSFHSGSMLGKVTRTLFFFSMKHVQKMYNKVIQDTYDIEVAFADGLPALLVGMSPNTMSKKILWLHNNKDPKDLIIQQYHRMLRRHQTDWSIVIGVNDRAIAELENEMGSVHKSIVVDNPILAPNVSVHPSSDGVFRMLSVGRLENFSKGFDRLIEAHAQLKQEGFAIELWIVGDGQDYEAIRRQIREKRVTDSVHLMGSSSTPFELKDTVDLFVSSSREETFGLVIVEALLANIPVLATKTEGGKNNLSGGTGMLVDNSTPAITEGLKFLIQHPEVLQQYREKAHQFSYNNNDIFNKISSAIESE